jgi:hypothetical protein
MMAAAVDPDSRAMQREMATECLRLADAPLQSAKASE